MVVANRQRPEENQPRRHPDNNRPASFTYRRSAITPRPQLPPRPHTRPSKPKGLPCLGEKIDIIATPGETSPDLVSAVSTPYRLPRIKDNGSLVDDIHKVWSRHGYDVYTTKPIELQVLASQLETSPRILSQQMRRSQLTAAYPKFAAASISPVRTPSKLYAGADAAFYKGVVTRPPTINVDELPEAGELQALTGLDSGPSPSPLPTCTRSVSPAKSAKSIHWALTQYRNIHVDKKGRSKVQGPFSREFTVRCHAPNNWMRMKYTRAKTVI